MSCLYCPPGAQSCPVCNPPAPARHPLAGRFPGARSTQRPHVARGLHPLGRAVREPESERCGTCVHAQDVNPNPDGKAIYQCQQGVRGVSCRVLVRWPACARWRSRAAEEAEQRAEDAAGRGA